MEKLEIKTYLEIEDYINSIPDRVEYDEINEKELNKKWVSVENLIELRKSLERKINKLNSFFAMKKYQIESKGRLLTVNQFLEDELKQLKELGE